MNHFVNTKIGRFFSTLILAAILFLAVPMTASAWYFELDDSDGDNTYDLWLRLEGGSLYSVLSLSIVLGYDPDELEYSGEYSFGEGWWVDGPTDGYDAAEAYGNEDYNLNGYADDGAIQIIMADENWEGKNLKEDTLLASITFNVLPGATIDGENDIYFPYDSQVQDGDYDPYGMLYLGWSPTPMYRIIEQGAARYGEGLDVGAVPVPGAVWLLGSGLLGLVGIRRKNRIR